MVTDIDILVRLGYSRELSRKALSETNGDRQAALEYIRTGGQDINKEWKSFKPETDWKNNIAAKDLPKDSQMRALWKSPVTAHINSFCRVDDGSVLFKCHVITHRRDWTCNKTLEDFLLFKSSLSFGTTLWFKTSFPFDWSNGLNTLFNNFVGISGSESAEIEKRRQMLDDWIRELTLSEKCMSDDAVLQKTLTFFGGDTIAEEVLQSAFVSTTTASTGSPLPSSKIRNINISSATKSVSKQNKSNGGGKGAADMYDANSIDPSSLVEVIKKIRTLRKDDFPMSVKNLEGVLSQGPFKILVSDFPELTQATTSRLTGSNSSDQSDAQLEKDLVRDRIIVNGNRHQGSSSSSTSFLDTVVGSCVESINEILHSPQVYQSSSVPLNDIEAFSKSVLRSMSRTESAYLSLLCINNIVDLSPTIKPFIKPVKQIIRCEGEAGQNKDQNQNKSQNQDEDEEECPMPSIVVPEAVLADPILLNFRILERKPSAQTQHSHSQREKEREREYCIDCEGQTSTVYRVCGGDSMDTLLQVRVVYSRRTFAMLNSTPTTTPTATNTTTAGSGSVSGSMSGSGSGTGSGTGSASSEVKTCGLTEKSGSSYLLFLRETKTTARDWK